MITVLLRSGSDPSPFDRLKVHVVTAADGVAVAKMSRCFDVVIHEASASNIEWIGGLINGQEERARHTERTPIFIYGGGTGVLGDGCHGDHLTEKIWSVSIDKPS
jgi:hypothetical protein